MIRRHLGISLLFLVASVLPASVVADDRMYASVRGRLPEIVPLIDDAPIVGMVQVRSVHKASYGHKFDWSAA